MDPVITATAITAVGGVVVAWLAASRARKSDTATAELSRHTALIEGYSKIVVDLQEEIARIRREYREDLAQIETDRERLVGKVASLETELVSVKREVKRNGRKR